MFWKSEHVGNFIFSLVQYKVLLVVYEVSQVYKYMLDTGYEVSMVFR